MSDEQAEQQPQQEDSLLESHVGFKLENILDHILAVRDNYTREHCRRVVALAESIGTQMALSPHQMNILSLASGFHDIGKIGIPDRILLKKGSLTGEEYEVVKEHPMIGSNMLRCLGHPLLDEVADCILHHHERWDGEGYPHRLAGEAIPVLSRIVSVVDAYDAMTMRRSYRQPLAKTEALKKIATLCGIQFCPSAVSALLTVLAES
jgi:HD-GYP domain-containing protein (c-di-GMP phosphodiesterase class II)